MSGKSINFNDKKITKSGFYKNKKLLSFNDIDVNKILVSKKESYDTKNTLKYFIGYNDSSDICCSLAHFFLVTRKFYHPITVTPIFILF